MTQHWKQKRYTNPGRALQVQRGGRRGAAERAAQVDPLLRRREGHHLRGRPQRLQPSLVRGHQSQPVRTGTTIRDARGGGALAVRRVVAVAVPRPFR